MEPGQNLPACGDTSMPLPSQGELLLPDGTSLALPGSFSVIGRAAGCELRFDDPAVSLQHCALVRAPGGLILRDLQSENGTLVNGERVTLCTLREGDLVTVGPVQFHVHLPAAFPQAGDLPLGAAALHEIEAIQREKDALRIQAAAVVAQQAALTEEEMKLKQREVALERQEAQLAAHLEAKRGQLAALQQQVSEARVGLRRERAEFEEQTKRMQADVERDRKEAATQQQQALLERNRLVELRRRLKRRWNRHWAAQEAALKRRNDALRDEWQRLAKENDKAEKRKADLAAARLCLNAEVELGRRQLREDRADLSREQRAWKQRHSHERLELQKHSQLLRQRESLLAEVERELLDEKEQWKGARVHLEKEIEGLDTRARNQRQRMLELQEEANQLQAKIGELRADVEPEVQAAQPPDDNVSPPGPAAAPAPMPAPTGEAEWEQVTRLDRLASDLADQRVHLAEQCECLVRAEENWRQAHAEVVAELEAVARSLQQREEALRSRERVLQVAEIDLRQRREELVQERFQLDAWRSRMVARESAWEGDRTIVLAQAQAGEDLAKRRLAALDEQRRRLKQRQRQESTDCQKAHTQFVEARRLYATLWEDCLRRSAVLDLEKRTLAERTLALEQYRLETVGQASDAAAAERQLERLRRRWAALFTEAERNLDRERKALQAELGRIESRSQEVERQTADIHEREAKFSTRQTEWEGHQAQVEEANARQRKELECLRAQREQQERQLAALRDEVERMAHTLLVQSETAAFPIVQAA
jgi:hypothetical protein